MAEILAPMRKPLAEEYDRGFVGMTREAVDLAELNTAREEIIATMVRDMPEDHRHFLLSFKRGEPNWPLLGIPKAPKLPAVLWKQHNLNRLGADKRETLVDTLEKVLFPARP